MLNKNLKNTFKILILSLLLTSPGAFAMKKADFIKSLDTQIALLEAEKAELLSTRAGATEYIILGLEEQIAALVLAKENA